MENLITVILNNVDTKDLIFPTLFLGVTSSQIKNIFFIWVMAISLGYIGNKTPLKY